jgi:signal transduction histidine kinase
LKDLLVRAVESGAGPFLEISVSDTGIGIGKEDLDAITS